jgi:hypothetical protein
MKDLINWVIQILLSQRLTRQTARRVPLFGIP